MIRRITMEQGTKQERSSFPSSERGSLEDELFALIRDLVHELYPQRSKAMAVSRSSRLERDLGIDSLGRTELILRIERSFGIRLGVAAAGQAETADDLLTLGGASLKLARMSGLLRETLYAAWWWIVMRASSWTLLRLNRRRPIDEYQRRFAA